MRNKRTNAKKPLDWYKMPVTMLQDPRIEKLIEDEGMKAFGLYCALLCHIYSKRCRSLTLQQVMNIKEKGCSKQTLRKVLYNYHLFHISEDHHVTSSIDFLGFNDDDSDDIQNEFEMNSECIPTPAHVHIKTQTKTKKNDYHHSKKSDDGDDDVPSVYRSEPMPRVLMDPIQYIHSIDLHSAWTEAVLQTLGKTNPILRQLVMEQWEETKRFFALHAQAQAKVATLLSENDVKRYFTNCLNNPTIASKLQEHLAAQRAKEQDEQLEDMCKLMEQES